MAKQTKPASNNPTSTWQQADIHNDARRIAGKGLSRGIGLTDAVMGAGSAVISAKERLIGWARKVNSYGFQIQGLGGITELVQDFVPAYMEEIDILVEGDPTSDKFALWMLGLSVAFGKIKPLNLPTAPWNVMCEYDLFSKTVHVYVSYSFSGALDAVFDYFGNSGYTGQVSTGSAADINRQRATAATFIQNAGGAGVGVLAASLGLQATLQNGIRGQPNELSTANPNEKDCGLIRVVTGPGNTEYVVGGNWPTFTQTVGFDLYEAGAVLGVPTADVNPQMQFDQGSRGNDLGVIISQVMMAANPQIQRPMNATYKPDFGSPFFLAPVTGFTDIQMNPNTAQPEYGNSLYIDGGPEIQFSNWDQL